MKERVDILLVDDRPDKLLVLETALAELDENLVRARSGREALKLLLRRDFAVILLDVNMPDMDGFETAMLIRSRPRSSTTPIIFVSAVDRADNHVSRGYSLGAVDYITSPFEPEILRAKVSVFVELHRKSELVRRQADERAGRIRAEAERVEAEAARERLALLARAGALLAGSLDTATTLPAVARLLADRLADFCAVALRDGDGQLRVVAAAHRDPALDAPARAASAGELREAGRRLGGPWSLEAPIQGRSGQGGVLHLARARDFSAAEAELAEGLAQRLALALDNAALYREAQEARQRAEEADHAKDRFLAMLSHELRTPLTPVLHAVDLLEIGGLGAEDTRSALAGIRRSVQLEARLIDDLLDLSRIARGKLLLHLDAVDAHALIANVLEMLRHDLDEKRLEVVSRLEAHRTRLWADGARVQQIFWNLLRNAVKFTAAGGRVEVCTADEPDGRLRVVVSDNGEGIEPQFLDRIFEAFAQTAGGRHVGGLGLGLTITRSLVEQHGGEIRATSDGPGKGAVFTVLLPTAGAVKAAPPAPPPRVPTPAPGRRRLRLLVVDDHPETLYFFSRMLRKRGYEVRTADCVEAALRAADEAPFDVLVSDVGLPDGTGMDLMRRLAERGPVHGVAISGYGTDADVAASKAAGFAEHITKPFDLARLDAVLQRLGAELESEAPVARRSTSD